ncbi:pleiotropic drug resistance protein 1 [Quercus suber]|uniref:Pleiotropic drug resistance protein 1 n=1 Tax=Quercus suber TaxID=58331 RepID=A0AAW0M6F5_QUESU
MLPPVFSGSARDGGCIFVPILGMPTPPLVHAEPSMGPSPPTPHEEVVQIEQILRTFSQWRVCGDLDALLRMLPIAGPVTAVATERQEVNVVTDYILKVLGLEVCADTLVGNQMLRGIFGGQRKRVSIDLHEATRKLIWKTVYDKALHLLRL